MRFIWTMAGTSMRVRCPEPIVFGTGTPGTPVATSALGGSFHAVPVRVHLPFMSGPTDGTAPKPILHEAKAGGHASVFLIRAPDEPVRPPPPASLLQWAPLRNVRGCLCEPHVCRQLVKGIVKEQLRSTWHAALPTRR